MSAENEMREFTNNIIPKEEVINICKLELDELDKNNYSNDYVKILKSNINNVYDVNIEFFENIIGKSISNNIIADFFSYKFYVDKKVSDSEILKIMRIPEREMEHIEFKGIMYEWNKRKAELSYLKHGLKFNDAIELLHSNKKDDFIIHDDRRMTFAFTNEKVFVVVTVEIEDGRVKRIISFRRSNQDEWNEAKRKYKNN